MANDLTGNPWVIDTPAVLTTDLTRVRGIRWVGATTAGNGVVIKDSLGRTLWESAAAGLNNVESDHVNVIGPGWNWRGITVTDLAAGRLYLELA